MMSKTGIWSGPFCVITYLFGVFPDRVEILGNKLWNPHLTPAAAVGRRRVGGEKAVAWVSPCLGTLIRPALRDCCITIVTLHLRSSFVINVKNAPTQSWDEVNLTRTTSSNRLEEIRTNKIIYDNKQAHTSNLGKSLQHMLTERILLIIS